MAQLWANLQETGKPSNWKPLACSKVGDEYILKVDTEISLDGLAIDNIKIASTDQTVGNAKYIKVKADGTVYIEGVVTITSSGVPEHWNGSVDITAWVDVNFSGVCKHIQIENTAIASPQRNLLISFDGGAKSRTIREGEVLDVDCAVSSIKVKGSNAVATEYEILAIV